MTSDELKKAWVIERQRRQDVLIAFEALHKDVLQEHRQLLEQSLSNRPSNVLMCTYCDTWGEVGSGSLAGWAWVRSACCGDDMLCCPACAAKGPQNHCGNCVPM